jgi:hypothetical protein
MRRITMLALVVGLVAGMTRAVLADFPTAPARKCGADAVLAGTVCLDRYEASVWRVPNPATTNKALVRRIRLGRATRADLLAGGATQLGTASADYAPCATDGQHCADHVYAVSVPAVLPAAFITWFQAQEACANAGKRLPTNAEWQIGANGTPDAGRDDRASDCNTAGAGIAINTGARSRCVSARGVFDMVGNVGEWVADWIPLSKECPGWGAFSDDFMCIAGANETGSGPGALVRGGFAFGGVFAGPLAVIGTIDATRAEDFIGFRCAR